MNLRSKYQEEKQRQEYAACDSNQKWAYNEALKAMENTGADYHQAMQVVVKAGEEYIPKQKINTKSETLTPEAELIILKRKEAWMRLDTEEAKNRQRIYASR